MGVAEKACGGVKYTEMIKVKFYTSVFGASSEFEGNVLEMWDNQVTLDGRTIAKVPRWAHGYFALNANENGEELYLSLRVEVKAG